MVAVIVFVNVGIVLSPHDLRLVSVEVVPTAETPRAARANSADHEWTGLSYRITLTSRSDLGDIADDWSMHTSVDSRFHGLRDGRVVWPWILGPFQDGRLLPTRSTDEEDAARQAAPPRPSYSYTAYLEVMGDGRYEDDFNTAVPYDLLTRPEPVSLRLVGGNMAFQAFRTNEVEIPAQAFADAYARYQRNQTP